MKKININGLLALNLEEIEIVYRRCRGDSVRKVAYEMRLAESTIWNMRIPRICKILGVEDWRDVEEELCIPLRSIIPSVEFLRRGWPEEFRGKIETLRETSEPQDKSRAIAGQEFESAPESLSRPVQEPLASQTVRPPPDRQPMKPSEQKDHPRPRRRPLPWPVLALPILLLCVAFGYGGFLLLRSIGSFLENVINLTQVTQPPIALQEPSQTPEQATAVPSFVPTPVIPTDTPTITLIPTFSQTPTITQTPSPTRTPTPTSTPENILFGDNFDDGRFEGWTIISGEPIGSNDGRLNAFTDVVEMSVGDNTWKNYKVEFDVYNAETIISNLQTICELVGLRFQDTRNFIGFSYALNGASWLIMEDGIGNNVPDTSYNPNIQSLPYKLTFIIQDNQFKVVNGEGFPTEKFPTGGVYLKFCKGTVYDNFKVIALP